MPGKAIICGGSIGGLFAAAALLRAGWDISVFERTEVELAGRGAGIVTHPELIDALHAVGADTGDLGVSVARRVAFDRAGQPVRTVRYPQVVTSWDRVHQLLRRLIPDDRYHRGQTLADYRQTERQVAARFAGGRFAAADLLVGADGFRSAVRAQMLPEVQPVYSGYVVWRALADEADIPPQAHRQVFDCFGLYLPTGTQIIGYPIAGPGNDLRPGHRRYNFVWYVPTPQERLADMLTDASGHRHAVSIPPPLVRADVLAEMEAAAQRLPAPFAHILRHGDRPFFTPIYDHLSPVMAAGRVALAGDAACVARPHVGMGVTKAAGDALALARALTGGPVAEQLQTYSDARVPAARAAFERARRLGSFLFQKPATGSNDDGRNNPNIEEIMQRTAAADF